MKRKLLGIAEAVLIALVILAGAIAVPVLFRPFFYWHIAPLELAESVGLTVQQVKTAYNEMMNFCVGLTDTFSVGVLGWSEAGKAHFADVRKLFVLDLSVLAAALILLVVVILLRRGKPVRLLGHTPGFWSAVGLGTAFAAVGALVAIDFEKAFVVFHQLFFPGKDNWLFDPSEDEVIRILPEVFFRNCAILIFALILIGCAAVLLWDRKSRRKV